MLNWLFCYLAGRHVYGVGCAPGNVFLRCVHCGHRSAGWEVERSNPRPPATSDARRPIPDITTPAGPGRVARVVPFVRKRRALISHTGRSGWRLSMAPIAAVPEPIVPEVRLKALSPPRLTRTGHAIPPA